MLYKVVLNGQCQGQDIKNILYYRSAFGLDIAGLTVGGTVEVANAVKAMVWPAFKQILPASYELQDISCYAYDDQDFHLVYQNPTTVGVQENGVGTGDLNGPAPCAIIRFALEPHAILTNGPKPPKRGYIAVGPMTDAHILDNGEIDLSGGNQLAWDALCLALSMNIETLIPPAGFWPVRVSTWKVLGILKFASFSDVRDCTLRTQSSFRRSRMPES